MARHNFLMIGQSNMSGRGMLSEVPVYEHASKIFMYANDGTWKQAAEPVDSAVGQIDKISNDGVSAGAGIGMAFANRLIELGVYPEGDEIGLIPAAKGSTFIKQWRRFSTRAHLYGSAVARAWEAEALGSLAGILWWQGEADTTVLAEATAYTERFSNLISDLRVDLQNLSLPFAFARLNNLPHTSKHPYWNNVRAYQTAISVKNAVMVSTDGVPFQADKVHATTAGYVTIGERFADAMAPLL